MPFGNIHEVTPLEEGCPWSTWSRPNLKWCENNLCSYITAPANTWSNLAYIFFGLWMMYDSRNKHAVLFWIGVANIFVGATSFAYHMSYTLEGQIIDFMGMYGFILLPIVFNFRRLRVISKPLQFGVFSFLIIILSVITIVIEYEVFFSMHDFRVQNIVAILVILMFIQELALIVQQRNVLRSNFWKGIFFILSAFGFSMADAHGIICDPNNHVFQGHAMWHLLSSVALQYTYLFYRQFDFDKDPLLPVKRKV